LAAKACHNPRPKRSHKHWVVGLVEALSLDLRHKHRPSLKVLLVATVVAGGEVIANTGAARCWVWLLFSMVDITVGLMVALLVATTHPRASAAAMLQLVLRPAALVQEGPLEGVAVLHVPRLLLPATALGRPSVAAAALHVLRQRPLVVVEAVGDPVGAVAVLHGLRRQPVAALLAGNKRSTPVTGVWC